MNKNNLIRSKLKSVLTESGGYNVYDSRFLKIPDSKLPAIAIYSPEEISNTTQDQGGQVRTSNIKIVLYAKGRDAIEAQRSSELSVDKIIDEMLEFIQVKLIKKIQTLDKLVYLFQYKGYKSFEDTTGEDIVIVCETMWEARYHVDTETP